MMPASTNDVLNRLLVTHFRSLPMYLVEASPWLRPGDEHAMEVLKIIADDQRATAEKIGHTIMENDGEVDMGDFPLHFTRFNDLSMDFLMQEVLRRQLQDIVSIEACVEALATAPLAKALAQEAYGAALGHLDSLQEAIAGEQASASHASV